MVEGESIPLSHPWPTQASTAQWNSPILHRRFIRHTPCALSSSCLHQLLCAQMCAWPRATSFHPVPSRTGSCQASAPESTARGTAWEARPPRAHPAAQHTHLSASSHPPPRGGAVAARRAHNPKVAGSNPAPATKTETLLFSRRVFFCLSDRLRSGCGSGDTRRRCRRCAPPAVRDRRGCRQAARVSLRRRGRGG
jgi:hypothetical protein